METTPQVTRRRMLQLTGVGALGVGAAIAASGCSSTDNSTTDETTTQDTSVTLNMIDPTGSVEIKYEFAPRLDTLDGKTIAFIADDLWEDDRTFPLLEQLFNQKYPSTKILREDNFPRGINIITQTNSGIAEALQAAGVDAVITGNAG